MTLQLKETIQDINYIKDNKNKLLWIAHEWDNYGFTNFVDFFDRHYNSGTNIYDKRNLLVHIEANDKLGIKDDIIAKKFKLTRKYDQFRFRFLDSKAIRSLKIALALQEIGVKTPKPVGVVEKRDKFNKLIYSYFITEYIDYDYNLLDILKNEEHPLRQRISKHLPKIAQDVRKMHDAGIVHNDLHAGNILVNDINQEPKFYYIDLNRGRIKEKLDTKTKMKDLARFKFTSEEQEIFMKSYAPQRYQELLDFMVKQREKRKRFLKIKRKLKSVFRK